MKTAISAFILGLAALFAATPAVVAADTMVSAVLPEHVTWCAPTTMDDATAEDEKAQEKARAEILQKIDAVLVPASVYFSSYPFVGQTTITTVKDAAGKESKQVTLEVCVVVPPTVAPPSDPTIKATTIKAEKVAARVCARADEDHCLERLRQDLEKDHPSDVVAKWPWRYVATLEPPANADQMAAALTVSSARPIRGEAKITQFGSISVPDPKAIRPLRPLLTGNVVVVPTEEGQWFVTAVRLP